ncbi:MAG TPA: DUF4870 domain-containing protein [Pyrinomonadaceae bacterium]|nr:DUF4870 domain-containing protein [Pyrinomonadaceae bacterium]
MSAPYTPPPPPPEINAPGGQASIGMDANLASMICYLTMFCCGLGIVVSLVFFFVEKTSRLLRFHAMQALLFGCFFVALGIVFRILQFFVAIALSDMVGLFGTLGLWVIQIIIALLLAIPLILAAIKAYQGQYFKLPIIGNIAWNIVNK